MQLEIQKRKVKSAQMKSSKTLPLAPLVVCTSSTLPTCRIDCVVLICHTHQGPMPTSHFYFGRQTIANSIFRSFCPPVLPKVCSVAGKRTSHRSSANPAVKIGPSTDMEVRFEYFGIFKLICGRQVYSDVTNFSLQLRH